MDLIAKPDPTSYYGTNNGPIFGLQLVLISFSASRNEIDN